MILAKVVIDSTDNAGIAASAGARCTYTNRVGVSAHRDAIPVIRIMQADIQNQGYAAGVASAMAAKSSQSIRQIHIKPLHKHLVEKGNRNDHEGRWI